MPKITLLERGPEPTGPATDSGKRQRINRLRAEIEYLNKKREAKIKELAALVGPPAPVDLKSELGE